LTNNHNVPDFDDIIEAELIFNHKKDGLNQNVILTISNSQISRYDKKDLAIITIPNLPPRKDITQYFPKTFMNIKTNGFYLSRDKDGSLCRNNLSMIHISQNYNLAINNFEGDIWLSRSTMKTVLGDCGSIMIGETVKGYVILGIHVMGSTTSNNVGSICVTQDELQYFENKNSDINNIQAGAIELSAPGYQRSLIDLDKKSTVRFLTSGTAEVYGSFAGFRPTHKSAVQLTPMAKYLDKFDYKIKYGPPCMKGWEPWHIAIKDMVDPIMTFNNDIINKVTESYINDIDSFNLDYSEIMVYDDFTAINGAPGVAYIDKINRNSSAGNPWKKSKKFFMEAIEAQYGCSDPVKVDDNIMDRVDKIILNYHDGKRSSPNFCAHLKDEAVSFKKVKSKKTRVFTGATMDWTIVVRKYLLSTVRMIQKNRNIFEAAPGTIAQSTQWSDLYDHITKFGVDRIIAGDYKSFDKRMPPAFILAAFKILKNLCIKSGNFSADDLKVVDGIAQDTAFPLIDFNGDLIQFYGSNPSGHPLTVIINSIVNSLYMRYIYYELNPLNECQSFKSNVSLMTYGDDNIMSVSRDIDWYNHTTISNQFAENNIVYTMADKEAESIPFIHIHDASFLKRTWRYCEEVGAHLAPLDHDSIEKMLMIWVRSKSISQEEQIIAVITSAVREYFFYDRVIFESKRELLFNLVKELDIYDWVQDSTFPTWEFLVSEFKRNSQ